MPNNRSGYGGLKYVVREIDGVYVESLQSFNWPTSPDGWPVGTLWLDGTGLRAVTLGDELLTNGDFELTTLESSPWGNWVWGEHVALAISDGANDTEQSLSAIFDNNYDAVTYDIELELGKRYQLSGYHMCIDSSPGFVGLVEISGDYNIVTTFVGCDIENFEYFEREFIAQTTTHQIQLRGSGTAFAHYFDEISLREVI